MLWPLAPLPQNTANKIARGYFLRSSLCDKQSLCNTVSQLCTHRCIISSIKTMSRSFLREISRRFFRTDWEVAVIGHTHYPRVLNPNVLGILPQFSIWTLRATNKFVIGSVVKYVFIMVKVWRNIRNSIFFTSVPKSTREMDVRPQWLSHLTVRHCMRIQQ